VRQGYDGQVVTIKKGVAACYDCEPKPAPKGFAVCTIRSTPDKPIHCIVWAKYLFGLLFGVKDDQNSITEGIDTTASVLELVKKLFVDDINKLVGMADLWKSRKPPTPLDLTELTPILENGGAEVQRSALDDHAVWPLAHNCAVLAERYNKLRRRREEATSLEFDKDDDEALDFVLCASNLRAHVFDIELQSAFRCKDIAGNIIPAIATTNAIIAGMMVMEAFKVVDGRLEDCKTQYKHREPTGRKSMILIPSDTDKPNPACTVCGGDSAVTVTINTSKTPFRFFLERILKQELGLSEPVVDTGDNVIECYREFEDRQDEARLHDLLKRTLNDPAVGIGHNAELNIEDEGQRIKSRLLVFHSDDMDVEGEKQYALVRREGGAPSAPAPEAEKSAAAASAPVEEEDDDLIIMDEVTVQAAAAGPGPGAKRGRADNGAGADGDGDGGRKRAKA
jgi:ubiquitin-like 1-activating enzyme E1 B